MSDCQLRSGRPVLKTDSPMRAALTYTLIAAAPLTASHHAHAQATELPLANWQHTMWTGRQGPPVPGSHYLRGSPDGYLWLSASKCLLRFDGVRFTVIDSTTTPVLRAKDDGEFVPIFLDRQGVMWISGPGGVRITYKDGRFQHALTLEKGASGPIAEDAGGLIWMSGGRPPRLENGRMSPMPLPAAIPVNDIWSVRPDTGSGLWVGTRKNGLWHVSRSGDARQYAKGEIRPLIQSRDGTLWALGMAVKGTARLEGERWVQLRLPNDSTVMLGSSRQYAPTVESEILGITTEAMTNARSHAGCRTVTITCTYAPRELHVRVRDDGLGFDASQASPTGHWGLVGMRERAASIGARLSISTAPQVGTDVVLVVPGGPGRWTWWNKAVR